MTVIETKRKKEGFQGQKAIVLPRKILATHCEKNELSAALYITDIGYYPKAKFHYRERPSGADQHILIYCVEGKGWAKIGKSEYQIHAGEFYLVPAHTAHKYGADENDPWTIYWIHYRGTMSEAIKDFAIKQLGSHKGFVHYNDARIELFNQMYNQLERGYGNENLVFVNMNLWQYLVTYIFLDKFNSGGKFSQYDTIDKAIDFMSHNIDKVISLEDIADKVNLSASHFSSFFKKKTGFSPIEYINHLKVQKACQYLFFSDLRVKEIANLLGIDDPYYFSRMFTKIMGVSPNEYRGKKTQ